MRLIRLHVPGGAPQSGELTLTDEQAHYLRNVLRARRGDEVQVFDGEGAQWQARVLAVDRRQLALEIMAKVPALPPSPLKTTLVQGVSRGERMDYALQKACELGVSVVQPVTCVRGEVKLAGDRVEKRQAHWWGVLRSAAEQCGRADIPILEPLRPFEEVLSRAGNRAILHPGADTSLHDLAVTSELTIAVGPEGGFDAGEIAAAARHGWTPITLGPRVLRTETAAPAALAAAQVLWGDL